MTKPFKYDIYNLIDMVHERPCLWDKTVDSFKDKGQKQLAWKEVFATLDQEFCDRDKRDQKRVGEVITGKWQNIRDSFVKSVKKQNENPMSRKYIYHDRLQFLNKVISSKNPRNNELQLKEEEEDDDIPPKKPRVVEDIDNEILKALRKNKATPDEDEAFFISITPSVKKMSEENKLEFRMGVLQLIKDINRQEKEPQLSLYSSDSPSSNSNSPTPNSNVKPEMEY